MSLSYISGGGNPISHYSVVGALWLINAIVVYLLITREFSLTFALVCVGIVSIVFMLFYMPTRESKILAKYKQESEKSRMIGNAVVVLYVIISIVVFALVIKEHMTPPPVDNQHQLIFPSLRE